MKKINMRFERYCTQKSPGDRASRTVDCYHFEVKLNGFTARVFDQYDGWYCHVGDYDETHREARKYADDLADVLGVDRPKLVVMVEKTVTKTEWVEEEFT